MHKKRQEMPKSWPVVKKGKKFLAKPSHSVSEGISILFLLRDILKIARTRKEVRFMTLNGKVKVNNKFRRDESFPLQVFDVLTLENGSDKKNYRLEIVNKKFSLKEVSDKESNKKVVKISGKKTIHKNKIQMNLEDGQNIISSEKFAVGDSAVLNTKENKIEKILALKEGANIEVVSGKHAGKKGKLTKIEQLKREKSYFIRLDSKEVGLPLEAILVIE